MTAVLHIELFGQCRIRYGNDPVERVAAPRLQSLLAFLLLHRDQPQSRRQLAYLLWPDSSDAQARTNLRRELHHLRQALPDADRFLKSGSRSLEWRSDAPFSLDVGDFEAATARAERADDPDHARVALEEAVALYRGDLLSDCYDEWLLPLREGLRQRCLEALGRLTQLYEAGRRYREASDHARRLLQLDPLHEASYRLLMRLHALEGNRAAALHVYHGCVTILQRELGAEPSPATRELYQRLLNSDTREPGRGEPAGLAASLPLVGRQQAWAALMDCWHRGSDGRPQLVAITGEAGIGKTRLAEELLGWCELQGIGQARTRSYAAEGTLSYAPVIEWLRSDALRDFRTSLETVWLSEVARLLPELRADHPDLPRGEPLTESRQRQRLFEALARAVLAAARPLLLVIDDLQWCDRDTLEWLHYLLRYESGAKLLVVGTIRSEEQQDNPALASLLRDLRQLGLLSEIGLEPLTTEDAAALAVSAVGHDLEQALQQHLFEVTEGHPLFVVEMARAGFADEPAQPHDGSIPLPPKVQAIITARLSQLSQAARELTAVAATVGRAFSTEILIRASAIGETQMVEALDELWRRRIVREQGVNLYDFGHDRIREVAYASVSPVRRPQLHRRVATALEAVHAADLDSVSAQLASHHERSGAVETAISWYRRSARVAARVYANEEVIRLSTRGLKLLLTLPESPERDEFELAMQTALGVAQVAVDGYGSAVAWDTYRRAEELSYRLGAPPGPPILRGLALNRVSRSELDRAYGYGLQLLEAARPADDPMLLVEAHYILGVVHFWYGAFAEAREHFETALSHYDPERSAGHIAVYSQDPKVICQVRLGYVQWYLGQPDQALANCQQALAFARELAHPLSLAYALDYAIYVTIDRGDAETGRQLTEEFTELLDEWRLSFFHYQGMVLQGWSRVQQGDLDAGIVRINQGIDAMKAPEQILHLPFALTLAARAYRQAGETDRGLAALEDALAMSERTGERFLDAEHHRLRGELHLDLGLEVEAEEHLLRALDTARAQGSRALELRAATSLGQLAYRRGDRARVRTLLGPAVKSFSEGLDTADLRAAIELLDASSLS